MNKNTKNILVFIGFTLISGWLGLWLNMTEGVKEHTNSTGMGVWLVLPMLTGLLLRWQGGDGWEDSGFALRLPGNAVWYLFSLLFFPVVIAAFLAAGTISGFVEFSLSQGGWTELLVGIGSAFAAMFVKNILEEFAWRGYLAPRLKATGINDYIAYLITGAVWTGWHIPYWAYFLPPEMIQKYAPYSLAEFILLGITGMSAGSLLLGELRFLTGSAWPAVIAHNVINAVSLTLLLNGYFSSEWTLVFTPGLEGALMTVFVMIAGLYIRRLRLGKRDQAD